MKGERVVTVVDMITWRCSGNSYMSYRVVYGPKVRLQRVSDAARVMRRVRSVRHMQGKGPQQLGAEPARRGEPFWQRVR